MLRLRSILSIISVLGLASLILVGMGPLELTSAAHAQSGSSILPIVTKDTNYPIPAGATFVDTTGNDSWEGSQASPWRTVQKAVNATPSGGTIVIRGGTYRESVALSNKSLTLQAYPHEHVWLKGSVVVTGWTADGTTWRKDAWSYRFNKLTPPSGYINPAFPLAGHPDMVFIDGRPLTQVGSKSQVVTGTFFVDEANQQLYIGDNPEGKTVEGSAYQNTLVLYNAPNSKVLGLGFAHAASKADSGSSAVVSYRSHRVLIENNTFAWNAASGMEIGELSDDVVVRGNRMLYNGMVGASTWGSPARLVFQGNHVASNNQERFNVYWAAGGLKLNGILDATVSDNTVENNVGTGLWCDIGCRSVNIVRNVVRNNSKYGIMYEISDSGIIASNITVNNGSGIYVSESTNSKVYNNTIISNATTSARSVDVNSNNRKTTTGISIKNNLFSHSSASRLWVVRVQDDSNNVEADSMVAAMDYNAYYRQSSESAAIHVRWGNSGGYEDFASLSDFQSVRGKELNGIAIDGQPTSPFFVNETAGDYQLKADSVAVRRGQPLPQDVADSIGVTAGVAVDLGALRWPMSDTVPPTAPSNLMATGIGMSQVSLSWAVSTDNVGVAEYDVYRNGKWVGTAPEARYTDGGLAAASSYAYYVTAKDAAGLRSGASNTASATTAASSPDAVTPTIPSISPSDGSFIGKRVKVSATATDNVAVTLMEVHVDGTLRGTSATSSIGFIWNSRSAAKGAHIVTVKAYDAAGNSSSRSVTLYK
ncbi:MAG TPA: right-handed parallel beta-helix repeat-containing protein [Acidimicrobiales bacterium]|nr:right-handed parallel beta-helix repeat-containing protein [Acidimicrobiales bacterium]